MNTQRIPVRSALLTAILLFVTTPGFCPPITFGRIEVDLKLDGGPVPAQSAAFATFFSDPLEGVSSGKDLLTDDNSYNISARSPVRVMGKGESYPAQCASPTPVLTYPFLNTAPLYSVGSSQPTPTSITAHSGKFVLSPGTGTPSTTGVIDDQCIP